MLSITYLFLAKIAIVTHLHINLRTCVVPKNGLLGPFLRLLQSCPDGGDGLFWPKVVPGHVGSAHKTIIVCWKIYGGSIGE